MLLKKYYLTNSKHKQRYKQHNTSSANKQQHKIVDTIPLTLHTF